MVNTHRAHTHSTLKTHIRSVIDTYHKSQPKKGGFQPNDEGEGLLEKEEEEESQRFWILKMKIRKETKKKKTRKRKKLVGDGVGKSLMWRRG